MEFEQLFDFGKALVYLKQGERVKRKNWNGDGIFIEMQKVDEFSKMTHSYLYINTTGLKSENKEAPRNLVPWLPSQTDMLSEDWVLLEANVAE